MNKLWYLTVVCTVIFSVSSYAQEQSNRIIVKDDSASITKRTLPVGEIVVSSLRINRQIKMLPAPMAVISVSDYQKETALTISNVLDKEAGIAMGGDGIWATNINIRGLSENRLVTLIDGNRVETATDLTASMSMIDVNDIERVEVIKGAMSSLYGSGAMGGIINIITKNARFSDKPYLSGNVISGFSSANKLFSEHAEIGAGSERWGIRLSGSYSDAGDIRTPEGTLFNSGYKYNNIAADLGVKPFANHLLKVQYQRYWATDVGIPGGDAFPGPAEASYSGIGRELFSASYEIKDISEKLSSLELSLFSQNIDRNVSLKPNTVSQTPLPNGNTKLTRPELFTPVGKHLTNGIQLQSTWELSDNNTLIAGVDAWNRKLSTERTKYITVEVINPEDQIINTSTIIRGETPIPNSSFTSSGVFVQDETKILNDRLTLIAGGRIDGVWINNDEGYNVDYIIINDVRNDSPDHIITFPEGSENSISWSANAGLLYTLPGNTDISLNLARSFRAPSLEERFKYIDLGNYVRLGDPSLKPESGYSADIGIRKWNQNFNLQAGVFVNHITNMIVEVPGEFIFTSITGTSETTTDTLPAFINSNVSKALLYGFDCNFEYNFYNSFVLYGSGSYVRGKDISAGENLPLIPPLRGRLGIRYTYHRMGSAEFTLTGVAKQTRIAEAEEETDGYIRLDMAVSTNTLKLGKAGVQVFAGIDNITDTSYTNHLSTNRGRISVEPGRNIFVRLKLSF